MRVGLDLSVFSDGETDMEQTSEDAAAMKKVGVRSFGIDDILSHTSAKARIKDAEEQREGRPGQGRSPLDALFTMTTNFESMKQKSGEKQRGNQINLEAHKSLSNWKHMRLIVYLKIKEQLGNIILPQLSSFKLCLF